MKKETFFLNKYDTCFYIYFSRAFQICSFSRKKVMDYFRFFTLKTRLFSALNPTLCIKKNYKITFKLLFIESHNFHDDTFKKESARTKNTCLGLNGLF